MRQKVIKELRREIRKDLAKEEDRYRKYVKTLSLWGRVKVVWGLMCRTPRVKISQAHENSFARRKIP